MSTQHAPLGEALKAIRKPKEKREIKICPDCGCPLIWTFCFAYNERYCLNCGWLGGMMSYDEAEETPDLIATAKIVGRVWDALYGRTGLLPRSQFTKKGCKKCTDGDHRKHLTAGEKAMDRAATTILKKLRGFYERPNE